MRSVSLPWYHVSLQSTMRHWNKTCCVHSSFQMSKCKDRYFMLNISRNQIKSSHFLGQHFKGYYNRLIRFRTAPNSMCTVYIFGCYSFFPLLRLEGERENTKRPLFHLPFSSWLGRNGNFERKRKKGPGSIATGGEKEDYIISLRNNLICRSIREQEWCTRIP